VIALLLLQQGAHVNGSNNLNNHWESPLQNAIQHRNVPVVKLLIERGSYISHALGGHLDILTQDFAKSLAESFNDNDEAWVCLKDALEASKMIYYKNKKTTLHTIFARLYVDADNDYVLYEAE
jgi:ankyrin repeat protein